jgi:hypothetical protein
MRSKVHFPTYEDIFYWNKFSSRFIIKPTWSTDIRLVENYLMNQTEDKSKNTGVDTSFKRHPKLLTRGDTSICHQRGPPLPTGLGASLLPGDLRQWWEIGDQRW